jgi:hypothetical protein
MSENGAVASWQAWVLGMVSLLPLVGWIYCLRQISKLRKKDDGRDFRMDEQYSAETRKLRAFGAGMRMISRQLGILAASMSHLRWNLWFERRGETKKALRPKGRAPSASGRRAKLIAASCRTHARQFTARFFPPHTGWLSPSGGLF